MSETSFTNAPHVGFIACISEYTFELELLCADHNASMWCYTTYGFMEYCDK